MTKHKVIIGTGPYHLLHRVYPLVAYHRGFFEEEGIKDIEIATTGVDEETMKLLARGDIDFVQDSKPEDVIRHRVAGDEIYMVGTWIKGPEFVIVAAKSIKSVEDLKGKRIGLRNFDRDGFPYLMLAKMLREHGMNTERDVLWVGPCGPSADWNTIKGQFQREDIHCRVLSRKNKELAMAEGLNILVDLVDLYKDRGKRPVRTIATNGTMVRQYSATVKAYLKGVIRAYRFMREAENWPKVRSIIFDRAKLEIYDEPDGAYDHDYFVLKTAGMITADLTHDEVSIVLEEMRAAGKLTKDDLTAGQVFSDEFLHEAKAEIAERFGASGY